MFRGLVREAERRHVDQTSQGRVVVVGKGVGSAQGAQLTDEQVALALARADQEVAPFDLVVQVLDGDADVVVACRPEWPFVSASVSRWSGS